VTYCQVDRVQSMMTVKASIVCMLAASSTSDSCDQTNSTSGSPSKK